MPKYMDWKALDLSIIVLQLRMVDDDAGIADAVTNADADAANWQTAYKVLSNYKLLFSQRGPIYF